MAIKMLQDLSLSTVRLLTNNPSKMSYLEQHCITVIRSPLLVEINKYSERYQQSKAGKLGHFIPFFDQL